MKLWAPLLSAFVFLTHHSQAADSDQLFRLRMSRLYIRYEQSDAKKAFDVKVKALLAQPTVRIETIAPYETCIEHHRKLGIGKLGDVDLARAICLDETVQKNETAILKDREVANRELAGREQVFRLVTLQSETINKWRADMTELSSAFAKRCKRDVACLERKQLSRYHQLMKTMGALAEVKQLAAHIGEQLKPGPLELGKYQVAALKISDDFEKTTQAVLRKLFDKVSSREDLPW